MKKTNKLSKLTALLLILALCLPFAAACGDKKDGGAAADKEEAGGEPAETTPAPATDPPPTEPTTEKVTEPPTEPPTDPANLPGPDKIARGNEGDYYEVIPGARYYLWSPNSGLYLTVDGDYKYAGLSQDDFDGGPAQMFVFETVRVEEGETRNTYIYKIRALGTKDGYVDVDGGTSEENGTAVVITSAPEGEASHEWELRTQARGKMYDEAGVTLPVFAVITNCVKATRVLDVSGVSKNPGGTVHLWDGGTALNQKWFFELVSDVESGKIIPIGKNEAFDFEFFEEVK